MSTPMEDLAHEAVACPQWRWMPGMIAVEHDNTMSGIVVNVCGDRLDVACSLRVEAGDSAWRAEDCAPDLSAPSTKGCVLALLRELHADPFLVVLPRSVVEPTSWEVMSAGGVWVKFLGTGPTEEAAMIAALKAAP